MLVIDEKKFTNKLAASLSVLLDWPFKRELDTIFDFRLGFIRDYRDRLNLRFHVIRFFAYKPRFIYSNSSGFLLGAWLGRGCVVGVAWACRVRGMGRP